MSRITVLEIAKRLQISRQAVYELLERGVIPGVRLGAGRRWIVTRAAFEKWEQGCGVDKKVA